MLLPEPELHPTEPKGSPSPHCHPTPRVTTQQTGLGGKREKKNSKVVLWAWNIIREPSQLPRAPSSIELLAPLFEATASGVNPTFIWRLWFPEHSPCFALLCRHFYHCTDCCWIYFPQSLFQTVMFCSVRKGQSSLSKEEGMWCFCCCTWDLGNCFVCIPGNNGPAWECCFCLVPATPLFERSHPGKRGTKLEWSCTTSTTRHRLHLEWYTGVFPSNSLPCQLYAGQFITLSWIGQNPMLYIHVCLVPLWKGLTLKVYM